MKIQRMTVVDPTSETPTVEMTLADHEIVDNATRVIVASVTLAKSESSMDSLQLAALREIVASVEEVRANLTGRKKAPVHALEGNRPTD